MLRKLVARVRPYCLCGSAHVKGCSAARLDRWHTVARYSNHKREGGVGTKWLCSCDIHGQCSHVSAIFRKHVIVVESVEQADALLFKMTGTIGGYLSRLPPCPHDPRIEHVPINLTTLGLDLLLPAWSAHALQDPRNSVPPGLED